MSDIIAATKLTAFAHSYGRMYAITAREMRRLDSVTKSPIFSLYSETSACSSPEESIKNF